MTAAGPTAKLAPLGPNAFDAIRLLAALQVAIVHARQYLAPELGGWWLRALVLFPGVPIFFFISGLLISRSWETNDRLRDYAANRALRIFPALAVCVAADLLAVAATGWFREVGAGWWDVLRLGLAKASFLQFYNPDFMRGFGDGVLNGSLWTICVELQFYVLVPVLYLLLPRGDARRGNRRLVLLALLSFGCQQLLVATSARHGDTIAWKLFHVSFLPWFYMFLVGVLVQRNLPRALAWARRVPLAAALAGYLAIALAAARAGLDLGNSIALPVFLPLCFLVFRAAFSGLAGWADRLRRNDVSYGVYIYHMPFVNQLLHADRSGLPALLLAVGGALAAATASWFAVEKPFLRRKRRPMHRVDAGPGERR